METKGASKYLPDRTVLLRGSVAALFLCAFLPLSRAAEPGSEAVSRQSISLASANSIAPKFHSSVDAYRYPVFPGSSFEEGVHQTWAPSRGPIQLFEAPREFSPGQPVRRTPRLAIAFRSNALRNGLDALGINAETCMAPIIRVRGKLSSGGDINSTVWISARCSFW